jgi:hypothetical protein
MVKQFTSDPNWWAAVSSQMRDLTANDNMTEFQFAQMRRGLMQWAQSRMNEPAFRPWAIQAMAEAQTMRRPF